MTYGMSRYPPGAKREMSMSSEMENVQLAIADEALAEYDFGDGMIAVSSEDWSVDDNGGEDDYVKVLHFEWTDDAPDASGHKVSFHAGFAGGTPSMIEAYAYLCSNGGEIGELPSGFAERREARLLKERASEVLVALAPSARPTP